MLLAGISPDLLHPGLMLFEYSSAWVALGQADPWRGAAAERPRDSRSAPVGESPALTGRSPRWAASVHLPCPGSRGTNGGGRCQGAPARTWMLRPLRPSADTHGAPAGVPEAVQGATGAKRGGEGSIKLLGGAKECGPSLGLLFSRRWPWWSWATSRSKSPCKPSQNLAEVPKYFARRSAVSAVMPRFRRTISLIRQG